MSRLFTVSNETLKAFERVAVEIQKSCEIVRQWATVSPWAKQRRAHALSYLWKERNRLKSTLARYETKRAGAMRPSKKKTLSNCWHQVGTKA